MKIQTRINMEVAEARSWSFIRARQLRHYRREPAPICVFDYTTFGQRMLLEDGLWEGVHGLSSIR